MNLHFYDTSLLYKTSKMGTYTRWNGSVFHLRTFIMEFEENETGWGLHIWLFE